MRSLEDLKARSKPALAYPDLIQIARCAPAPARAYDNALRCLNVLWERRDFEKARDLARACRFLAIIRRDYGEDEFEKFVSENTENTDKKEDVKMGTAIISEEKIIRLEDGKQERIKCGPKETVRGFKVGDVIRLETNDINHGKKAIVLGFQLRTNPDLYYPASHPDNRSYIFYEIFYQIDGESVATRRSAPEDIVLVKRDSLPVKVGDLVKLDKFTYGVIRIIDPLTEQALLEIYTIKANNIKNDIVKDYDYRRIWEWHDSNLLHQMI